MTVAETQTRSTAGALDGWLRLAEAARLAGASRMTVHRAASRDEIAYAVTPLGRLFRVEDVERWARSRA